MDITLFWHILPEVCGREAKTIFEVKLFMAAGYDGLDTSTDKTMIVFGNAKKVVEAMLKAV